MIEADETSEMSRDGGRERQQMVLRGPLEMADPRLSGTLTLSVDLERVGESQWDPFVLWGASRLENDVDPGLAAWLASDRKGPATSQPSSCRPGTWAKERMRDSLPTSSSKPARRSMATSSSTATRSSTKAGRRSPRAHFSHPRA